MPTWCQNHFSYLNLASDCNPSLLTFCVCFTTHNKGLLVTLARIELAKNVTKVLQCHWPFVGSERGPMRSCLPSPWWGSWWMIPKWRPRFQRLQNSAQTFPYPTRRVTLSQYKPTNYLFSFSLQFSGWFSTLCSQKYCGCVMKFNPPVVFGPKMTQNCL